MPTTKAKPKIRSNNKSYTINDSGLFNIQSKSRLGERLGTSYSKLTPLKNNSNYIVYVEESKGKKKREIQYPKLSLDLIHTRIASLLVRIKVPDYVHSGVKKKSNITNAKAHIGDHPVLTMDLQQFYPSISKKSVFHFFNDLMRCSPDVAGTLAELCTYADHVPTGSRLSMVLSFWTNYEMYSRLKSLCDLLGITMTCYVDDLTFSGAAVNRSFEKNVKGIVSSAGMTIHPDKTRLYRYYEPKLITGVIVHGNKTKVRNKHHKNIHTLFENLEEAKTDIEIHTIYQKLLGNLSAAGQIEPAFKQRARSVAAQR